jgi:RNA-directed DNA polymerase
MVPESKTSLIRICALAAGLTESEVNQIAQTGPKRYKVYQIPKRSGGRRTICHPSRELKALQYVFLRQILNELPVHKAATAYKVGSSIKSNAAVHTGSRVILKLDFENFFPSIKVNDWEGYAREAFPHWTQWEIRFSSCVMFWGEGGYIPRCLSIGAPTSPLLSNVLMHEFDIALSNYCASLALTYSRYADDITISSEGNLDKEAIIAEIKAIINSIKNPTLRLNNAKTKLASNSTSRRVTGLVISNDGLVSLGRDRKRNISAMVHHAIIGKAGRDTRSHLAGLLSFANDVEPSFIVSLKKKYGEREIELLRRP